MILLLDQALFTACGKQVIEAALGLQQLGLLDVEHSADLAIAVDPLLVGAGKPHETDPRHQDRAELEGEADAAADQLLTRTGWTQRGRPIRGGIAPAVARGSALNPWGADAWLRSTPTGPLRRSALGWACRPRV